jgi:hypothetical protein
VRTWRATMKITTSINYILRLFAFIAFILAAVPNAGSCAALDRGDSIAMHSCCAAVTSCNTSVMTVDCCCKAAPVKTAAMPGLIVSSPTEFVRVAALPQTPLPANYYAVCILSRTGVIATATLPKIYIVLRALLI